MKNLRKQWVFILWLLIFTLVLVIGLFGHLIPIPRFRNRQFWHYWEVAALGASVLYNGLFYILGFFFPPQMFLRLKPQKNIGYVILLMGVALVFLVGATSFSLTETKCSYQLLFIL